MSEKPKHGGLRGMAYRNSFRRQVWWLLRKNKRMTVDAILQTLWDGEGKSPESNISKFLRRLAKAGILTVENQRQPDGKKTSNGLLVYQLANDIGPKCPVLRSKGQVVFDPNAKQELEPIHPPKSLKAKPPPMGGKGGIWPETEECAT